MTAAVAGRPYLAPVPDTDPPFDPDRSRPGTRPSRSASRADLRLAAPTASAARPPVPARSAKDGRGQRRAASAELPPAGRAAQVLSAALVEMLSGRRPVGQLRSLTTPAVYAGLADRVPRGWNAAHVSSVRVCQPAAGVAEVCAVVRGPERVHAIAFRIEGVDGRWRITALDIG